MRLIIMFDLPMKSKKDVRNYTDFRKYLIKSGYIMMQFSIYCKIMPNRDSATKHKNVLKNKVPKHGNIRIIMVTEKQYANIDIIIGGVSNQEDILTIDPLIIL